MIETICFLILFFLSFGYAFYKLWVLYQLMRHQKGKAPSFQHLLKRTIHMCLDVFSQRTVLKNPLPGILHATIFWGFVIISVGTLEQFISMVVPGFTFSFLGISFYHALIFFIDLFTLLVLLAVLFAFYRRWILRPSALTLSRDAYWILLFTGTLMIAIFGMNSFAILGQIHPVPSALVFSQVLTHLFLKNITIEQAQVISHVFKWLHMLIVMGFAAYIPGSKHLHLVAAGPNLFFQPLRREKALSLLDFEDPNQEQFGASKITDLSWKDALDAYACTECGRCQDLCPAYQTGKPLSPKFLIHDLKENMLRYQQAILKKQSDQIGSVIDKNITEEVIWDCTSCRACEVACPVGIQHLDKIFEIRRALTMMEARFPTQLQTLFKNLETYESPWAFPSEDREKWAEGLEIPKMREHPDVDYLVWVGCAGAFDARHQKVMRAFVKLLQRAKIRFAILGKEEKCTGDAARRAGNEYLFQMLAKENIETFKRYQVKQILTTCPHCFNTFKNEYPALGATFKVTHHSIFLQKLLKEGKLRPSQSLDARVTFHDSCYLGRWNQTFEAPRLVIKNLSGAQLEEMEFSKEKGFCCGAGGARMWMEETKGKRVNLFRAEQALKTQATIVGTSCPFCLTMLSDGVKALEHGNHVQVKDIAELLEEAIPS